VVAAATRRGQVRSSLLARTPCNSRVARVKRWRTLARRSDCEWFRSSA